MCLYTGGEGYLGIPCAYEFHKLIMHIDLSSKVSLFQSWSLTSYMSTALSPENYISIQQNCVMIMFLKM